MSSNSTPQASAAPPTSSAAPSRSPETQESPTYRQRGYVPETWHLFTGIGIFVFLVWGFSYYFCGIRARRLERNRVTSMNAQDPTTVPAPTTTVEDGATRTDTVTQGPPTLVTSNFTQANPPGFLSRAPSPQPTRPKDKKEKDLLR